MLQGMYGMGQIPRIRQTLRLGSNTKSCYTFIKQNDRERSNTFSLTTHQNHYHFLEINFPTNNIFK